MIIPQSLTLTGQYIQLRPEIPEDYPQLCKILSDSKTMENLEYLSHIPNGWTLDEMRTRCENRRDRQHDQKGLSFVVCLRSNEEVIGQCGCNELDLEKQSCNMGRIIHHPYWGTGIATECLLLMCEYAFEALHINRIELTTFTENNRSRKSLEKFGFTIEGTRLSTYGNQQKEDYIYAAHQKDWPNIKQKLIEHLKTKTA